MNGDTPYLSWLTSVGMTPPDGMDEEACALAAAPPPREVYSPLEDVRRLVIHHSATRDGCAALFRLVHRGVWGWVDVGYHYVIGNGTCSGDGGIEKGRPDWAVGAHARGANNDSLGICLVGDFEVSQPTRRQMAALRRLIRRLSSRYALRPPDVLLHREVRSCHTLCPGRYLTALLRGPDCTPGPHHPMSDRG